MTQRISSMLRTPEASSRTASPADPDAAGACRAHAQQSSAPARAHPRRMGLLLGAAAMVSALTGCGSFGGDTAAGGRKGSVYQNERFQADETFSRLFDASVEDTCEAARRALLSQGYVINLAQAGSISGSKRFQPEGEVHVEIAFNIVCVPEGGAGKLSTAYVSALQDRYTVKRSTNSTSLGVSAIGSISVPLSSTSESLVKVASETIPAGQFYDRFFALMQKMLREQAQAVSSGEASP